MPLLLIGKGFATVLGAGLLIISGNLGGTDLASYAEVLRELGEKLTEFGLLRKAVIDWNLFGNVTKANSNEPNT